MFQISSNCLEMIRHLTWIELNLAKNLTQDEIINQLMNENQSDQEYPNWRLNCNFFNVLSASTQFTVLSVSLHESGSPGPGVLGRPQNGPLAFGMDIPNHVLNECN